MQRIKKSPQAIRSLRRIVPIQNRSRYSGGPKLSTRPAAPVPLRFWEEERRSEREALFDAAHKKVAASDTKLATTWWRLLDSNQRKPAAVRLPSALYPLRSTRLRRRSVTGSRSGTLDQQKDRIFRYGLFAGGDCWTRTSDLMRVKHAL